MLAWRPIGFLSSSKYNGIYCSNTKGGCKICRFAQNDQVSCSRGCMWWGFLVGWDSALYGNGIEEVDGVLAKWTDKEVPALTTSLFLFCEGEVISSLYRKMQKQDAQHNAVRAGHYCSLDGVASSKQYLLHSNVKICFFKNLKNSCIKKKNISKIVKNLE